MTRIGLRFQIQVQSALHVGQGLQNVGEYQFTRRHIPGSTLRGALAAAVIRRLRVDPEAELFHTLFSGPEAVRFEPAFPTAGEGQSYPFPLTARSCKDYGGFPPVRSAKKRPYHGVFDVLADQFAFEEHLEGLERRGVLFLNRHRCPHDDCSGKVEPATDGGYVWHAGNRDRVPGKPGALPQIQLVRHTHTAINRARNVAEDRMLYTLETIEPETVLEGCVWAPEDHRELVRDALSEISHLGRGAHRGQGRVDVRARGSLRSGDTAVRIEKLTSRIKKARSFYGILSGTEASDREGYYFTVDLLAPAIFGGDGIASLRPARPDVGCDATLVRTFVAPVVVGGWWSGAQLPYPTALAAEAGSVFLYRTGKTDLAQLSVRLDALRAAGLGERRERGYGAFVPCAPFHLWTAEEEAKRV
jgi:CRISPR-associated Csx10 family RAMP protein